MHCFCGISLDSSLTFKCLTWHRRLKYTHLKKQQKQKKHAHVYFWTCGSQCKILLASITSSIIISALNVSLILDISTDLKTTTFSFQKYLFSSKILLRPSAISPYFSQPVRTSSFLLPQLRLSQLRPRQTGL